MKQLLGIALGAAFGMGFQPTANGSVLKLDAPTLFEQSVAQYLRLSEDRAGVELEAGELFEDDGPASGHSYQKPANQEVVTRETWIKKELIVPHPEARAAFLVVLSEDPFEAVINGIPQQLGENQSGRKSYKTYAFNPKILKPGRNEIILRGSGKVLIARDDEFALGSRTRTRHPNRSAKSTDAGKTWDYDHLGPGGRLDGEYGVRVFLDHYRPQGLLTMPVMDAGNLEGKAVGPPVTETGSIKIAVEGEPGPKGRILVRARSGSTYVPADQTWSGWQVLGETGGTVEHPRGRYVQVALELSTRDALRTPTVKSMLVAATPVRPEDWTSRLRVLDAHNEQIVRTSIPFEYEPLDHPQLKRLREQYKLDEVVQGAHTELELLLRLAQWACNRWDWPNHITENYPPWDALEILKPHPDGTPIGGFCQQFNLVLLQAGESFGFPGRAISISQGRWQEEHPGGGHEIVEFWSNEWKKWVYVDGALAWYIVDRETGVPHNLWELRQMQLQTLRGESVPAVRVVDAVRTKNKQFVWNGLGGPKPLNWYLELRMIPRSNFLQEKSPLPLNQGTEEWSWTGHYVWTDSEVPAGLLFDHRVARRTDFEWTLNQAHFVLEPTEKPGTLRVHLDTETPSFDTFLAEIDAGKKEPVVSGFAWPLHPGKNYLRVRPRNVTGREGIPSWITLEYR
ncbi:MAG: transglutaminase-like domain-containing protein [Limisphaerales bacterium]